MNRQNHEQENLLRRALMGNAWFSAVSGLMVLVAHGWVSRLLGLRTSAPMLILGISLLGFAAMLAANARREFVKLSDAWTAVLMDLVWVVGSYALLFVVPFSSGGRWLVALVAELVLVFAVLQWLGIRRIKKAETY